jgi:hypothetical protein
VCVLDNRSEMNGMPSSRIRLSGVVSSTQRRAYCKGPMKLNSTILTLQLPLFGLLCFQFYQLTVSQSMKTHIHRRFRTFNLLREGRQDTNWSTAESGRSIYHSRGELEQIVSVRSRSSRSTSGSIVNAVSSSLMQVKTASEVAQRDMGVRCFF